MAKQLKAYLTRELVNLLTDEQLEDWQFVVKDVPVLMGIRVELFVKTDKKESRVERFFPLIRYTESNVDYILRDLIQNFAALLKRD